MKRNLLVFILVILFSLPVLAQTVTIEGYAFLQGQTDHSGIKITFHRTVPTDLTETVTTASLGYYSKNIQKGIYDITFSKNGYYNQTLKEIKCFDNKSLDTIHLYTDGLMGILKGVLKKGEYIVTDNLWVPDNDTLIIEPGTKLFFKSGKFMIVDGFIIAEGTEKDSIFFTSYISETDNPDTIFWKGITLNGSYQDKNRLYQSFKYCHFSHTINATIIDNYENLNIENSLISDCMNDNCLNINSMFYNLKRIKIQNMQYCPNYSYPTALSKIISVYGTIYDRKPVYKVENIEVTGLDSMCVAFICRGEIKISNAFIHDNKGYVIFYDNDDRYNTIISNSTIVNNNKLSDYKYNYGKAVFQNCILANNPNGNIDYSAFNSNLINTKSPNINNKWLGLNVMTNSNGDSCDAYGNITLDPQFVNPSAMDYHLKPTSPCIDAGVNDSVRTNTDFDNHVRIFDGNKDGKAIVDMGAFEFDGTAEVNDDFPVLTTNESIFVYPNPSSDQIMILAPTARKESNIVIQDIFGFTKYCGKINNGALLLDIKDYPAGTYFITIGNEKGKFVKM